MARPVIVYEMSSQFDQNKREYKKKNPTPGFFTGYGVESDENGGTYTVGIIEFIDGTVSLVHPSLMIFQDGVPELRETF